MWKPDESLAKFHAGQSLEAIWINEFARAYYELCDGCADHEFIYALAEQMVESGVNIDPHKVAELASIAVTFDMPDE